MVPILYHGKGKAMTFEEQWKRVSELEALPDAAVRQIPDVLSKQAKMKLAKKTPEEAVVIIQSAINDIDRGSVETVNDLVLKKLK